MAGFVQVGIASYYGGILQGHKTSSGEIFDTYAFTAAHKTLPYNTLVKVTNLKNKKSVIVRINDRGPYVKGRIIDLSYAAAKKIGLGSRGIGRVKIEVIGKQFPQKHTSAIRKQVFVKKTKKRKPHAKLKPKKMGKMDSQSILAFHEKFKYEKKSYFGFFTVVKVSEYTLLQMIERYFTALYHESKKKLAERQNG
ncbi:MAG: septal ring lytic transglycosylase RlpA family protein [Cytophagaceae bacterium]|nr:septal ring lytic transglycosylase RlpA family protein [Cytophagaceae bacterium]